jgi:large subunit ribosomal protein L24
MKIRKDDKVKMIAGKNKDKTGKVLQVLVKEKKASVEGINILVKNMRSNKEGQKGQKIEFPSPVSLSNMSLVCPKCNKSTKVGFRVLENSKKIRVCKKCKETI